MLNNQAIRVLYIDLSGQIFKVKHRQDLLPYLGGVGVSTKLLSEHYQDGQAPLAPQQPIIFACGPLTTIFPTVTKVVAGFVSPLTRELGESYAGGRLGFALKFTGYDAIVITGEAEHPLYLSISSKGVKFNTNEPLWGTSTEDCGRILRDLEPDAGFRSIIRIGSAGEKQIPFAGVNVDTYRHFGRLGLGAVMGSKKLKAIVIIGDEEADIQDFKAYNTAYQKVYKKITQTDLTKKYHDLGTSSNVIPLNAAHSLPTCNLQLSTFAHAEDISGEAFAEKSLIRKYSCTGCPIGCIHVGLYRREFSEEHDYKSVLLSYDHELIFALGSMLGMKTINDIYALIERVETYGLDVMTTGVVLAWATEAYEKGLIRETELGVPLQFGKVDGYAKAIDYIIAGKNEFYQALARGANYVSAKYGGSEFAMTMGGHEMAGYHTGYANILGLTVGARHSHLDNAGYAIDQKLKGTEQPKEIVDQVMDEEKERNVLNCLIICLFGRKVYDRKTVLEALHAIGINFSEKDYDELGEKIFNLKWDLKKRMRFDLESVYFPQRFFETECMHGKLEKEKMEEMLDIFKETLKS